MHALAILLLVGLGAVSAVPKKGCYDYDHKWWPVGPVPTGDACKTCECWEGGKMVCNVVKCPKPYCPEIAQYRNKGDCCVSCKPGCGYEGRWFAPGEPMHSYNKCEKCKCGSDGKQVCSHVGCQSLKCPPAFHVKDKGACCPHCMPACVKGDQWYKVGEHVENGNPCDSCYCQKNGEVSCQAKPCPHLSCPPQFQILEKGACCKTCLPFCAYHHTYYKVGEQVDNGNKCDTCFCAANGDVECKKDPCPALDCPRDFQVKDHYECCPRCMPACVVKNEWFKIGQQMPSGKCEKCWCGKDGKSHCEALPCPNLPCPPEFMVQDGCCKKCEKACVYYNTWYKIGAPVDNGNKCDSCVCGAYGRLECKPNPCPKLDCPYGFQVPDGCCKKCAPACVDNGKWYKIGQHVYNGNKCDTCYCAKSGKVECSVNPCPGLHCPADFQVLAPGACCKHCKPACVIKGDWYMIGNEVPSGKCETCVCGDYGRVSCKPNPCPTPKCPYDFQVPDGCCKKCKPACVDKMGIWYHIGAPSPSGKCESCKCGKDGNFVCTPNPCPSLDCPPEFQVPYGCCKKCKPACVVKGVWHKIGSEMPSGKCETCHCSDYGRVMCKPNPCPVPKCPYDFQVQDGCCKKCKPACVDHYGKWYMIGSPTPSEKCESCKCMADGNIACSKNPCPPADCPADFQVPYGCCKKCKPACVVKGNWFHIKEMVPGGPCESCYCGAHGKVECHKNPCPEPKCPYDFQVPDGCCKKCKPACIVQGTWFMIGQAVPGGKCESCKCGHDGHVVCSPNPCPKPNCPYEFQVQDGCCKKCKPACVDQKGNWFKIGSYVPGGKCESCKCTYDGKIVCTPNPCPAVKCPYDFQVQDGCCKKCKPACVDHYDKWFHIGSPTPSGKCESCKCTYDGKIACTPNACPALKCPAKFQVPDGCCKKCKPHCVDKHNNWYPVGASTPSGKCESCHCGDNGYINCQKNPCPKPKCPEKFWVPDAYGCCKKCQYA